MLKPWIRIKDRERKYQFFRVFKLGGKWSMEREYLAGSLNSCKEWGDPKEFEMLNNNVNWG